MTPTNTSVENMRIGNMASANMGASFCRSRLCCLVKTIISGVYLTRKVFLRPGIFRPAGDLAVIFPPTNPAGGLISRAVRA